MKTNLILTVLHKELETIQKAAKIEDEYIEDYVKNIILAESMRIVKRHEQEEKKWQEK